jgi:hypothetical protein
VFQRKFPALFPDINFALREQRFRGNNRSPNLNAHPPKGGKSGAIKNYHLRLNPEYTQKSYPHQWHLNIN